MRALSSSVVLCLWLTMAGCSAPPATLELITAARSALADAQEAQEAAHDAQEAALAVQLAALDAGFDADVRRVAGGQLLGEDGRPVELTGQWVIDARKGYAAASRALHENQRRSDQAHLTRLDNLKAGDEALQMASDLIVRDMSITEPVRQQLLALQRRFINGK